MYNQWTNDRSSKAPLANSQEFQKIESEYRINEIGKLGIIIFR